MVGINESKESKIMVLILGGLVGREGWDGQRGGWMGRVGGRERGWGGQRGMGWAERGGVEGAIGLRERSNRLAASEESRAVQDRAPRSGA